MVNSKELSEVENLWLKDLSNDLDMAGIRHISEVIYRQGKAAQIRAYLEAVLNANIEKMEEAFRMSDTVLTLDKVLENIGLTAKWEARGEARGEGHKALEIALKMKELGDSAERIHTVTGLSPEVIDGL